MSNEPLIQILNKLTSGPLGSALILFEEGYAADSWAFKGQWSIDKASKTLKIIDRNAARIVQILPDGGLDGRVAFFGKQARVTFRLK